MTKEIVVKGQFDIAKPSQVVAMANILKKHIVHHNLYTLIAGKSYVHVEGWQFAGMLAGLYPRVTKVENLSEGNEMKWRADAEIVRMNDGQGVANGFAICSNKESKKKTFDEYAILSMAQTRAIGKAYRNLLGWVMKLAGYEATPAEEMFRMGEVPPTAAQTAQTLAANRPAQKEVTLKKGQVIGPEGKPVYVCANGEIISEAEYNYSMKVYGRPLCRTHQHEAKPKQQTHVRR